MGILLREPSVHIHSCPIFEGVLSQNALLCHTSTLEGAVYGCIGSHRLAADLVQSQELECHVMRDEHIHQVKLGKRHNDSAALGPSVLPIKVEDSGRPHTLTTPLDDPIDLVALRGEL